MLPRAKLRLASGRIRSRRRPTCACERGKGGDSCVHGESVAQYRALPPCQGRGRIHIPRRTILELLDRILANAIGIISSGLDLRSDSSIGSASIALMMSATNCSDVLKVWPPRMITMCDSLVLRISVVEGVVRRNWRQEPRFA
jgi:hypothetical protein